VNPFDVAKGLEPVLERTGDTPVQFAGRLLGLGAEEQRAGVPKWAYAAAGLVGGVALMWAFGDDVRRWAGALRR
jgi:hypothetical protein